jgi:hypothetical protein
MWHLRRVHMQSIGHPDARFDPLTLDFVDEGGEPASSVLWLENMGGKTSWLSLFFSVLQPGLRDFLGRPRKRLGEYVASKDTAHVILEFSHVTGARTLKGTGTRLVIGQVLQWKGRRQDLTRESSQLDRRFWGAVITPDSGEESLFDRVRGLTFTEEGHRAPLDAFVAGLGEELSGDVFRPDDNQSKWAEWLTRHSLDPTVFKHQIKMSADEGSISETFQFQTGDELVQWALPYIVPPDVPNRIAETVDEVRDTLQRKPSLEAEQRFCREIEELLTHTAAQQAQLDKFRGEAAALWDESLTVVDQMREAAEERRRAHDSHAERAETFKKAADEAQNLRNRKQGQWRMAEYVVAQLRYQECARGHADAEQTAARLEAVTEAWSLTESLRKKSAAQDRLSKVEAQLREIHDQAAPKRAALETAAERLSAKLEQLLKTSRAALAEAEAGLEEAARLKEEAREEAQRHRRLLPDAQQKKATAQARLEVLDRELAAATEEGLLSRGQSIEEGLEAARDELSRAEAETKRLAGLETEARVAVDAARREAADTVQAEQDARQAEQQAVDRLERMREELSSLLGDERVAGAFQAAEPDPWADGPAAIRRLGEESERASAELVSLAVDSAEDRRALDGLERGGALPPRVDVERVLEALAKAGIRSAFSGWEVLRTQVSSERREAVIGAHPELVEGVLLTDAAEMEAAEAAARSVAVSSATVLAPAEALTSPTGSDQVVVLAGPAAQYDETAADRDREQRLSRLEEVEARRAVVKETQGAAEAARAAIRHFLATYPASVAKELREDAAEKSEALLKAEDRTRQAEETLQETEAALGEAEARHRRSAATREERERRHSRLQQLETSQKTRPEAESQLKQATTRIQASLQAIEATEAAEQKASDHASQASVAKLEAQSRIREWEGMLERHQLAASVIEDEVAGSLDVLEQSYLDAKADLEREAAPDELTSQRATLAAEISELGRSLQSQDATVVTQAEQLLATPEGADASSRREATQHARRQHTEALKKVGAAEADLDKATEKLRVIEEGDSSRRVALDDEPETIPEAEVLQERLSNESAEALRRMNEAQQRLQHHQQEVGKAEAAAADLDDAASDLAKVLVRYADEIERDSELPNQKRVAAAWTGEPQNAREERSRREDKLVETGDYIRLAVDERKAALEKVRHLAEENRDLLSAEMPALVPRLTQGTEEQRGANASDLAHGLQDRAVSIEKQLGEIQEHRNILVDQLTSQARETVKLLARLQNRTTLPEELSEWGGRPYLTLNHPPLPETSDELKGMIAVVVDQICNEPTTTPTDGIALLYKAVSAGVGGPFTARILKPNKALKPNRVDISEMATFSGGQKVTSALVMFAALTRMRAEEHSAHQQTKAVVPLLLDNPIGKANQATLIEVQQRVANAYGLQLIYTTGIHDIGALASFRVTIRIEGMEDTKTGRIHLQVDEEASRLTRLDSIRLVQHDQDGEEDESSLG